MKYARLSSIKRLYFGYEEIAKALGISNKSAIVTANRYVKQGLIVRFKRNIYILSEKWKTMGREEFFALANIGQVPSYISLMTAMAYHEVTTQVPRDFIESVAVKRTKMVEIGDATFNYVKIEKKLYKGFYREKGFFIARPEKAFLDAIYLMSFGRYRFDLSSIDIDKLDRSTIKSYARCYPIKTKNYLREHGYIK